MRVKIPISSGLVILLMGLTGIALAGCLPGLQDKNSMDIERHVPGPGWFYDGWQDFEDQPAIRDSSVSSSVDITAAAAALWPVVVADATLTLIRENEQPSDYQLDEVIEVWVPSATKQDSSSGEAFWNSMQPTDVYVVVMRHLGDGRGTGFAMARKGAEWQYSEEIPLDALAVAEGVAVLQAKGIDADSVRLLCGGPYVLFWLMYPTSSGDYDALLLGTIFQHDLYIADRRIDWHEYESVPWRFVTKPIEMHRFK